MARELESVIGLDRRADLSTIAVKELPAAMLALLAQQIASHLLNLLLPVLPVAVSVLRIDLDQDAVQHDIFGRQRDIGFQLGPPVSVEILLGEQVILRPANRISDP